MLVGNAGVGKTILVSDKVTKLKEDFLVAKVPFNYYTTSAMLQRKNRYKTRNGYKTILDYQTETKNGSMISLEGLQCLAKYSNSLNICLVSYRLQCMLIDFYAVVY